MRRLVRFGLLLVLLLLGAGLAVLGWAWHDYTGPGPLREARTVIIERGSGVQQIARQLEEAGAIRHAPIFAAAVRLTDDHRRLQAGEYRLPAHVSAAEIVDKMARGDTVVRRITIAEGLTAHEALQQLKEAEGLVGEVPQVVDGELLPNTYHYAWGDSRADLVARMRAAMDQALERLWAERPPDFPLKTPNEVVTLASIVEKETGVAGERARIAGVFLNRLDRGMPLQSDPTVIYALTDGDGPLDRPLTRADLRTEHPYNTYAVPGLPPGPIANPGLASIEAVLHPDETDELFFVADGTGGHAFARTLQEHNRNVVRWRRIQDEQQDAD